MCVLLKKAIYMFAVFTFENKRVKKNLLEWLQFQKNVILS